MTPDDDRGLVLRCQALALLEQAAAVDGLKPFAVTHQHEFGASTYLLWSTAKPTESDAVEVLDSLFEPERNEWLTVEEDLTLQEMCGVSVGSRTPA